MNALKLYRVTCKGMHDSHGSAYVVALSPGRAYRIVREHLDREDFGFGKDRALKKNRTCGGSGYLSRMRDQSLPGERKAMTNNAERDGFEKWAYSEGFRDFDIDPLKLDSRYKKHQIDDMWRAWQAARAQVSGVPAPLEKIVTALRRFDECAEDGDADGCDIGRDWFDALTFLGLLNRVQRSPALWEMTEAGEELLNAPAPPKSASVPVERLEALRSSLASAQASATSYSEGFTDGQNKAADDLAELIAEYKV